MKFNNNISFPHPVLGIGDAVSGNIGFSKEPTINVLSDRYKILIECNLENDDLLKLLEENKVEFYCEITCTNTVYRRKVISGITNIEFEIFRKQVKGKVEFKCLLVAKENLSEYSNSDAHLDYSDFKFDLDKGDVLAFFGEFDFNADIKYEKLKAITSFMVVVENSSLEYANVDLKKSKIEIQLPTNNYNNYVTDSVSKEKKFTPIFHSSLVLNALLIALYNFEDHEDYLWAKTLKYRLEKEDQFKNLNFEEKENIPEIAQRLLGNPFDRLFNGLTIINDVENED